MNILYIIGTIGAFLVMVFGMVFDMKAATAAEMLNFTKIMNFWDPASVFITIG